MNAHHTNTPAPPLQEIVNPTGPPGWQLMMRYDERGLDTRAWLTPLALSRLRGGLARGWSKVWPFLLGFVAGSTTG